MKKVIVVTFSLCFAAGSASAADMATPLKAAPAAAPAYSWSGCYAGLTLGYSDHHVTTNWQYLYAWDGWSNGVIGGGELGCNLQYDSFVYGIEIDGSGLSNKATQTSALTAYNQWSTDWLATARLRAGIAVGKTQFFLSYGVAGGHTKTTECLSGFAVGGCSAGFGPLGLVGWSGSATRIGYALGAGIERALDNNWSAKVEALYVDLGEYNLCYIGPGGCGFAANSVHNSIYIARVGVNYKFYSGPSGGGYGGY
jgi:outer membrane immunogenic protein